jgi:hypothetical protein
MQLFVILFLIDIQYISGNCFKLYCTLFNMARICYRCHLIFQRNSIADLHTEIFGHPTSISEDIIYTDKPDEKLVFGCES